MEYVLALRTFLCECDTLHAIKTEEQSSTLSRFQVLLTSVFLLSSVPVFSSFLLSLLSPF